MKLKKLMNKIHEKYFGIKNLILILLLIYPIACFADSDALVTIVQNVTGYLSGKVAGAFASIVLVWAGYELWAGVIGKIAFATICVSLGLIFGGAYIGHTYLLSNVMS